ncbi:MAG TPA: hypothetical protein VM487_26340 [Phycisphaerae bacterium]|nr:hypothetical protein [Phycisphaerae bacterium]
MDKKKFLRNAAVEIAGSVLSSGAPQGASVQAEEIGKEINARLDVKSIAVVDVKSAWLSKINLTQIVAGAAALLTLFGIDVPAEVKADIITAIVAVGGLVTWMLRTWFTSQVTRASMK